MKNTKAKVLLIKQYNTLYYLIFLQFHQFTSKKLINYFTILMLSITISLLRLSVLKLN